MALHVLDEAKRCLQCKNPQCRQGCPIHTNIPEMIRMLREKEILEAAEMLFENNPLSMICSLVCNHEKQCEGHCILGKKGAPIHISAIENYISDSCFERLKMDQKPFNGMKAAVIGAGPAGITISIMLALRAIRSLSSTAVTRSAASCATASRNSACPRRTWNAIRIK